MVGDSLAEALRQCNLVFDINQRIHELEELKKEAKKESKKNQIVLLSEIVTMRIVDSAGARLGFGEKDVIINKMEMYCILNPNASSIESLSNFFISLRLYSQAHVYSFLVAKNNRIDAGYLVQIENEEQIIRDGGHSYVKFSSAEDFEKVIKYCDECLATFNSYLKKEKLIAHFNDFNERMHPILY